MKPREIRSYLEDLAKRSRLQLAPRAYLTRDNLIYNDGGRLATTLLHLCAKFNGFDKLPAGSFGEEDLLINDASGDTPIRLAALYSSIDSLPLELLNPLTLCHRDSHAGSAMDHLVESDRLYLLPSKCLTPEVLLEKSHTGATYLNFSLQKPRGQRVLFELEHERLWAGNPKVARELVHCDIGRSILSSWDQKRSERLVALKQKLESIKLPAKAEPKL